MKALTTTLGALSLAAALVLSGCSANSGSTGPTSTDGATESTAAAPNTGPFDDADVMFATMMIPHHRQAIEMSDMLLAKEGIDAQVAALAQDIKDAQGPEITQLTGWLGDWDQPDPTSGEESSAESGGASHGMGDGMMSEKDMAALENATGKTASDLFLDQMIDHHNGAIDMAQSEVDDGKNPAALDMAETIVSTQKAEVETMERLLDGDAGVESALLRDNGLTGLDVRGIIDILDRTPLNDRPADLMASVEPGFLTLSRPSEASSTSATLRIPMPADEVYVSVAPYRDQTHECHFHSLTTCVGELSDAEVNVQVTDASGAVVLEGARTTFDNGFVGLWLPRDLTGELTISSDGDSASVPVSTVDADDATCVTTARLA